MATRTAGSAVALTLAVAAVLAGGLPALGAPAARPSPVAAVAPPPGRPAAPHPEPTAPPEAVHVDLRLPAHPTQADLTRVQGVLAGLAAQVQRASDALQQAAGEQVQLRVELGEAADRRAAAEAALDRAVRSLYESSGGSRAIGFIAGVSPVDAETVRRAGTSALHLDAQLVRDRAAADAEVARLSARAEQRRQSLVARAAPVELAQARARDALDQASAVFASDQAALAALAAQRAALDAAGTAVALAVSPAVSAGGQAAAAAQAPLLALLEQTPLGGVPQGFHRTGKTVLGSSSWYGPGFVGSPTSSGSPYDPNQLTCAMLAVPLGTVVRVTTNAGRVITVLVTDHGPYVPGTDRVIDLSARAARLVGVGLTPVSVEVLERD